MPGEIRPKTIGRREARAFAKKYKAEAGSKQRPDRISNRDPALLHQSQVAPVSSLSPVAEGEDAQAPV